MEATMDGSADKLNLRRLGTWSALVFSIGIAVGVTMPCAADAPATSTPVAGAKATVGVRSQNNEPSEPAQVVQCWSNDFRAWLASQPSKPDEKTKADKSKDILGACLRSIHVEKNRVVKQIEHVGPIGPCEGEWLDTSLSAVSTTNSKPHVDDFPQGCQYRIAPSGPLRNWFRVHLRGGNYGNRPDPMFNLLRPSDGNVAIYATLLSRKFPGTAMSIDEQLQRWTSHPQGEPLDALYALLHRRGNWFTLLPLNYSPVEPPHRELPWGPVHLSTLYDAGRDRYLLYLQGVSFLTSSWDSSLPSWETFYVWWLDAKNETITRQFLPAGPWVADAMNDGVLLRAFRNFSCGTDCYRHYAMTVASGDVFVTISGRPSAISESVTGTYKLGPGGTTWERTKN
jgi:hypothetical protein